MIHATAIIHPSAKLAASVQVGAYAVIDENVSLGADCILGPYVHLTGHTTIGKGNVFHTGCVIGDEPQDLKYKGEPTRVVIGDHNVFREHANVHRSNNLTDDTVIGSHNFLMANSHIGHNVRLGDHVIVSNGVLIAGHATIADRAFLSGNSLVHQFTRVGTLALMQGGSAISKDLPPFTMVHDVNRLCGLNIVGLRRAGFSAEERLELKRLYKRIFRSGQNFRPAIAAAQKEFFSAPARTLLDFLAQSKRGFCADDGQVAAEDTEG